MRFTDLAELGTRFLDPPSCAIQTSSLLKESQVTPVRLFAILCNRSELHILSLNTLEHKEPWPIQLRCEITGFSRLIKNFIVVYTCKNSFSNIPNCCLFKNYLRYVQILNISIFSQQPQQKN